VDDPGRRQHEEVAVAADDRSNPQPDTSEVTKLPAAGMPGTGPRRPSSTRYQHPRWVRHELQGLNVHLQRSDHLASFGGEVAALAHEMRNALGVAMSSLDLALARTNEAAPELRPHLEHAQQGCEAALRVLNGALRTARQSSEQKVPVSLFEVARRIADLKGDELHRDAITIRIDVPPGMPRVLGSPFELQQVLLNLVTNAQDALRQATGPRAITLVGFAEDGSAGLEVRDTGP